MHLYTAPKVEGYTFHELNDTLRLIEVGESFKSAVGALQQKDKKPARDIAAEFNLLYFANNTEEDFWNRVTAYTDDEENKADFERFQKLSDEVKDTAFNANGQGEEVGYWRKANHIHHWFVQNVQNGEDDCGEYEVPKEKLYELRDICEKVSLKRDDEVSERLLPTIGGFLFGGTEYDQYYYDQVYQTLQILDTLLTKHDLDQVSAVYTSSW